MPRIALIHALAESVAPINSAFEQLWPDAARMNLLDDSLSADLAASPDGLDERMHERFIDLTAYAIGNGAQGVLFTCSAFGSCIDAAKTRWPGTPIFKPNEAMIAEIEAAKLQPVALLASFAPTLLSMPPEFDRQTQLMPQLCEGALSALKGGDPQQHDALVVSQARALKQAGAKAIALAQFSMARAAPQVAEATGLPVYTTPDSAVRALRTRLLA